MDKSSREFAAATRYSDEINREHLRVEKKKIAKDESRRARLDRWTLFSVHDVTQLAEAFDAH